MSKFWLRKCNLKDPHPELVEEGGAAHRFAMDIHVYMLRCRDGSYYVGLTKAGLDKRMAEHHAGTFKGYTSARRPVELVWNEPFLVLTQAIECERRLKGWRREKKEALIRREYQLLPALARTAKPRSTKAPASS